MKVTFVILFLFLDNVYTESDPISTCNKTGLQECLLDFVHSAFDGYRSENCSFPFPQSSCVAEHLKNCRNQLGTTLSPVFSTYIELLERIHEKSCKNQAEIQSCDLSDAKSCIADFMVVMTSGYLGSVCRQSSTVLNCLSPTLERCSGFPRYLVALVTDEIQLTTDYWCSSRACRLDVASQCIDDAMEIFDYPAAIEMQSNLICRNLKSSLACAINNTELCPTNTIPVALSVASIQISQFSSAYCGMNPVMETMMSSVPRDLVAPLYLAALTSNAWTSEKDICRIYNATIKEAAFERISFGSDVETLLTWQQYLSISLDKLSDTCLNNDTLDCDWMTVLANEGSICDPPKAEKCVDIILLSKLTVEVNLMRTSWESTCSVAYNMIACAQYHTGSCVTADLSSVIMQTQEIENLVGYECSQLGADDTQGACDIEQHRCESARAVHECIMFGYGLEDRCREKDKIYSCFQEHMDHCDSAQRVPAQFYMEWLLNTCSHNFTLLADDIYTGVSRCKLQYGYNLYNGILGYSDFNAMVCSVTTLYRQCLAEQFIPSVVVIYMQEVEDFYSAVQLNVCNVTRPGSDLSTVSEAEDCLLSESASEIALSLEFYSNFPFMSLEDQEVVCRTYPSFKDIWASRALSCSMSRQSVISDAISYFNNIHNALCSVSRPDVQRSCDATKVQMCLEDFGAFTYFAKENSDICRKVEETFECLMENTRGCDDVTHDALLQEVMSVNSLLGNVTCQKPKWCATDNSTDWFPWQRKICSDWDQCLLFDWMSCVDQYNLYSCQFYTEGVACIEEKLSSCNPIQILLAKSEMEQWIQQNSPNCYFVPNDPSSVTQVYKTMFQCSYYISQTQDVSKQGLCNAIDNYLACLASTDPSDVPYVWRAILGRNGQLWRKRLYLDCQLSSANTFLVGQDFNPDNITGGACTFDSQYCLLAFTNLAVTYFHLIPLSDRFQSICERSNLQYECVISQASGCTNPVDRYLLTSAEWIKESFDNAGTCSNDNNILRECNPDAAMECVADLGHVLINDLESVLVDTVCSKLQSTAMCVNLKTSSCDYFTRSQVAKTFNQISAIIKSVCSPTPIMPVTTSCLQEGEATQCDLEEFLMCIVPVQAMLLHPNSTWGQICRPIPEMKTCIHRSTSGCDEVTMRSVYQRLHRLSHRLNDQCPQFYCEECMARSCLVSMQRNLQYQNASLCGVISETKQCLYQHAGYCEMTVRDNLLREMNLLAGQDAYLCEITLPSCLQTFTMSALQISGYTPLMHVSTQNDYLLGQLCNEANTAYYCISQHLTSIETKKLQAINSTLEKIGNIIYGKCQGSQLQCYSCVNATSNEGCNQRNAQTCSADMQMCGTVFTGTALYKGCVKPELCQTGCNGTMCSMCCGTSLCNQPWNNVILEPASCQPEAAMYCGFQLLASLVQNESVSCMNLQESLTCMIQSTQSCMSSQSMTLGILARDLLTRDIMSSCIEQSPVCGCGQCTSMLLLSVVSSPFGDVDKFCRTVFDMYNRTLLEMDLTNCSMSDIQTTAYNLQLTIYMTQGICSMQDIDNTSCNYNGMMYSHGASFMAEDGCNYCSCNRGDVACTLMYCPPDDRQQCPDIDPDQAGTCDEMCSTDYDCNNGQLCCSNGCGHVCTQPKQQGAGNCYYGNQTYNTGDSFIATDGCNFCFCYDEIVSCTEMYCPSGGGTCHYDGVLYQDRDTFPAEDGCNTCICNNGNVACTYMSCPPDNRKCPAIDPNHAGTCIELCSADSDCADGQLCCSNGCGHVCTNIESEERDECNYDGMTYRTGESFTASDGCNTCFCTNGLVGCTKMYCPTEDTCDIQGVQTCINDAALPYLMLRASTVNARHICMSAASLLKCVEAKVNQCPNQILDIIHSAVWSNLNMVQSVCNINDIIWLYTDHGGHANYTVPAPTGKCSLQKGVECFSLLDDSDTCSSYQSMIDCVYNFTSDCLTIDVVPVLFELKAHVEEKLSDCDLDIPRQNKDPFYPIANCMTEFGASMNSELTLTYLRHGRLDGVCDKISVLIGCLHNISNVQPAGKLFVSNLVASLANLVQLCNDWDDDNAQEIVRCHHCQGFTDMEKCDSMPVHECQQNQVCATALQLDQNSGVAVVTKGCADLAWCQISHGCNPYFMSCVSCCHGDRCNSADNMITNITTTTDSWMTTSMKQTKNWRTTSIPHTQTPNNYDSCHIDRISTVLTANVLRLMTFNNLPAYDRQFICKNDFKEFGLISDHLHSNCPEDVDEHVRKLIDWLREWKADICGDNTVDDRCIEAIQCVSDIGNFTNKNSTCRSISKALDCLQTYYSYCNSQGQMSINSTRLILSDMNYVICKPNKLFGGPEDIECVSLETTDATSARCDLNMTMECTASIEKAYFNPFMTQDDFCRVGKRGLVCIRDNSYNCSMETITSISPKTMQLLQAISQSCPDAFCPAEQKCNLEPAWQCIRSLEAEFTQKLNDGSFNRSICMSIARTHHCVINATQNCNIANARMLFHQFSVVTLLAGPWCNEQPVSFQQCFDNLHHGVDSLMNSTDQFIAQILESTLQNVLLHHLLYKDFDVVDTAKGMALLGLDISLFKFFSNETEVNLPGILGYLFKNSNNLDKVNLPALAQFLSKLTSALQPRSDGDDSAGGDGLNLPGGGSTGGQDSRHSGNKLPGDNSDPSDNGGFGYGLNLPGGYGSQISIDVHKNIEQIIAILFRPKANTASEITNKILDVFDMKLMDVLYMIDERSLMKYTHYKSHLCNGIQHSVDCAYGTLHNILMKSSKKQEFLSTTTLRLLSEQSYDMCQELKCYSCNELHSNEECNAQPLATCGPLQVCQSRFYGSHFYKGCVSTLTCQQECQEGRGQCYCCEGNQCNQDAVPLSDDAKCRIQSAVDAAIELLAYSTSENYKDDGALIRKTATDMINATKSCHGKFQKNFRNEGERMMLLFEAESCAKSFISKKCEIEGLYMLTHMVSASFSTIASTEAVCSLYDKVLREVISEISVGRCCDHASVETLIDIFHLVHPVCKEANIEQLCMVDVHTACSDLLPQATNSSRMDSKKSTYENEDRSLSHMCSRFMHHISGEANKSRTSEIGITIECNLMEVLNECFGDIGDAVDCSDATFDEMVVCVQNHTNGCLPMQSLPVMFVMDRFYYLCGKDINIAQLSNSDERGELYRCIKQLATVNMSVEVENTLVSTLCDAVGSANDCLNAKQVRDNSLQSLYFNGVQNKMNRFISVICASDSKKEIDMIKRNNTCQTELLEKTLYYLNFVITSPFALMNDICRYTSELERLDHNITACSGSNSIGSITTWINNEVTEMCNANMAGNLCRQPTCDVPMATDLLEQLGYYLLANGFDDFVFCQKTADVLQGVKCVTHDCEEDLTSVTANIMYIKSLVGSRCPLLTDELFCADRIVDHTTNTSSGNEMSNLNANSNRNSNKNNDNRNNGNNNINATERNRESEICDIMASKLCVYSMRFPSSDDRLYCSKMVQIVSKLSDCVTENLIGCDDTDLHNAAMYYRNLFLKRGPVCYLDLTTSLFAQLIEADQCTAPQCSHRMAYGCFSHFKYEEGKRCGNFEDVKQCVYYATEGCNEMQQYVLMSSLEILAETQNVPGECWQDVKLSLNESSASLTDCLSDFNHHVSEVQEGHVTGSSTCRLMQSLLTCIESMLELANMPSLMKEAAGHIVYVTKPSVETFCKHTATVNMSKAETVDEGKAKSNKTCDIQQAQFCMKIATANILLLPMFSAEGKQFVCNHLSEWRGCLHKTLSDCSDDGITRPYFSVYSLTEVVAQLSGACSPEPVTCSPEVAMECVSSLGHAISQRPLQQDTCWAFQRTKLCISQTMRGCDNFTWQAFQRTYVPFKCKALALCPAAFTIFDYTTDTPQPCIDLKEVVIHSGTCSPSTALRCLQDFYLDVLDPNKVTRNAACGKYPAALSCFFNNINACEDDMIVLLAMYYLPSISEGMDIHCETKLEYSCPTDGEHGCNLKQMEECIAAFRNIANSGHLQEQCLGYETAKHCFEMSTMTCPRITRLYAKAKFIVSTSTWVDNHEYLCDNIHQCTYNYMMYFKSLISSIDDHFYDSDDDDTRTLETKDSMTTDPTILYQCRRRLEELSCIQNRLKMLPEDIAMFTNELLLHRDSTFSDICAIQTGLLLEIEGCNQTCMQCLLNKTGNQSEIALLLSFVADTVNESAEQMMFSSSRFCRIISQLQMSGDGLNVSCFADPESQRWEAKHMKDAANLLDKYCSRPCNETQATYCIEQFRSDISKLNKEEICLSFNETLKCLEDSVSSCETTTTSQFVNEAQRIFTDTEIVCYTMPTFEVSYNTSEMVIVEGGISRQGSISVTMTTPVMSSCYGNNCYMELYISMEQPTTECSSGSEIQQILMDSCVFIFNASNTDETHEFNFYPRVDHKIEPSTNVTVNIIEQLWEDGLLATGATLASVTLMLEDRDTPGVCYLISEPTIRTFDSLLYYSFYQGEYILYQHDTIPERVHVGFQPCRPGSYIPCPCVIMVLSGDDTFILDRCRRFGERNHALEFTFYKNNDLTEKTKVYTLTNRDFFQFVLPSGTIVNVRSGRFLLDAWIKPSALDFGHTSGLCGTYDGDMENDLTMSDNAVEPLDKVFRWPGNGNLLPYTFVNSWRPENTLFGGVLESNNPLPSDIEGQKCMCVNSTCIPMDMVQTCDFIIGEDITAELDLYTQIIENENRRKRQTEDIWNTIDFNPEDPSDQFPTWPTDNGFTETNASKICETALKNHASWDICNIAIDTTSIISSCVTEILLTDTDEFVNDYVEDMKVQCKLAVLADPTISALLNQTQEELVSFLLTLTCLNDCSNHGQCVNDICQCDTGYNGDDCSGSADSAPVITSLSEYIYSGTTDSALTVITRQVTVYGSGFENSASLACHLEQAQVSNNGYISSGVTESSSGTFLTSERIRCDLTGSMPLTGVLVSVSNNGVNRSNDVLYIFQDEVCYDCDPAQQVCNLQPTSCMIAGQCYRAGTYNPIDQCLVCDPVTNVWTFKPSSSCTSTSKSTTVSSTSSTSLSSSTSSSASSTSSTVSTSQKTSSSPPSSSSTSSSTSLKSTNSTPSKTMSTTAQTSSTLSGQGGETSDQDTFNIVIITGACVGVLIIIVTVIFACRLRRSDKKASETGSSTNSLESPKKKGQSNPGYSRGEPRQIAGDPVIQPRRVTEVYSANFNTEGLEGRSGAPAMYGDDPGLQTVNIDFFDENRDRGASKNMPTRSRPLNDDVVYDNARLERQYTIPRPYVDPSPAGLYPEVRRQTTDAEYDNAAALTQRPNIDRRDPPMPDYYEDDGSYTITKM